ncbi:hypothetical protein F5Y08DRAFT_158749 [Xylaria arbuscula]|nr:hypothetical protein F5Y08DRAFT_158749 [Xylaria arbuscula]
MWRGSACTCYLGCFIYLSVQRAFLMITARCCQHRSSSARGLHQAETVCQLIGSVSLGGDGMKRPECSIRVVVAAGVQNLSPPRHSTSRLRLEAEQREGLIAQACHCVPRCAPAGRRKTAAANAGPPRPGRSPARCPTTIRHHQRPPRRPAAFRVKRTPQLRPYRPFSVLLPHFPTPEIAPFSLFHQPAIAVVDILTVPC